MGRWKLWFALRLLTVCVDSNETGHHLVKPGREPDATPICTNTTESIITLIVCKIHTEGREECRLLYKYGDGFVHECDSRFTLMLQNHTVFLHLTSLTPVDSGNYTCECSHNGGTDILHLNITVEDKEDGDASWPTHRTIINALIGVTTVISITAVIFGFIYRGIRHRKRPEPLSSFPNPEPEDIEPYSTFTRRESGLYSTVKLHNCNTSNHTHTADTHTEDTHTEDTHTADTHTEALP